MGFWSGIGGALTGLATGGPVGGIVGGLAGAFGNEGNEVNRDQSSSGSRSVDLRSLTPQEQGMMDSSFQGIAQNTMTPAEAAAMEASIFENLYNPAKANLDDSYSTLNAQNYAERARRGAGANSRGQAVDRASTRDQSKATADLTAQSTLAAMQARQAEQANRRAQSEMALRQLMAMWNERMAGSKITTSGNQAGTVTGPDTTWNSILSGAGNAMANPNSYYNTNMTGWFSGGEDPSTVAAPVSQTSSITNQINQNLNPDKPQMY